MKKTICLLVLIGCVSCLQAQTNFLPGYIITNEGDTLHGLIDYRSDARNARRCDFRQDKDAPVKEFLPGSIRSYRFEDSKYYVSHNVPLKGSNEPVFLEFLVNGISDLYYYSDGKYDHYYIEKQDSHLYELSNDLQDVRINDINYRKHSNKYIGLLKVAFTDCPELYPAIDHAKLDHKSLITISRKYHEYVCKDNQCVVYEKKVPSIHISFGAAISASNSHISFTDLHAYKSITFERTFYPTLALMMNTTMPRVSEKLSLELSVEAGKASFNGAKTISWPGYPSGKKEEYQFETSLVKANVDMKYTFPRGKFRPVGLLGINYGRLKNEEIIPFGDTVDRMAGIHGSLGLDYYTKTVFTPFVRFGYESSIGSERYTWQTNAKLNTVKIQAGFYF